MAETDRVRVQAHWDGLTRAEALRRLLALHEQERTIYSLRTWWRRLKALWAVWRAR